MAKHWIQGAVTHPGALHRALGVPAGQTIPAAKIAAAAQSSNPTLAARARLAETLEGLRHEKKKKKKKPTVSHIEHRQQVQS